MDEKKFWEIISLFHWDETGDDEAVLEPACKALASLEEADIFRFEDILSEKLHALDTREHCNACYAGEVDPDDGDDYISADDFLYCRCVVVANGQEFFSAVLADPSQFPRDFEFEAILSLPAMAFEQKTGRTYEHMPHVSYESFSNEEGWRPTKSTKPGKFTGEDIPPGNRRPT